MSRESRILAARMDLRRTYISGVSTLCEQYNRGELMTLDLARHVLEIDKAYREAYAELNRIED